MRSLLTFVGAASLALLVHTSAHAQSRGHRIDLSVQRADVRHVIQMLADEGGVNVVFADDVSGTVTVHLRRVRWDEALAAVLRSNGLEMERVGSVIRIAPSGAMARERESRLDARAACLQSAPLRTRTFRTSHASAAAMAEVIRARLTPRGSVSVDERTQTVIVRDVDCP